MRKYKKLRFLTIIFLSFCFPSIAIYLDYNTLVEADFLHAGFQFEDRDLEDLLADKQDFQFFSVQPLLANPFEVVLFLCILAFLCQGKLSDPKPLILRC